MSKILSTSTSNGTEVYQKYMATSSNTDVLSGSEIVCQNNIDSTPIICTTDAEMNAGLTQGNIGKVYKFSGNNSSTYQDGDICVVYEYVDVDNCLCFTAIADTDISFNVSGNLTPLPSIEYSLDKITWNNYTFGNTIALTTGKKCYWKGNNSSWSDYAGAYIYFASTGSVAASGNIMSLLDQTCQSISLFNEDEEEIILRRLFYNCSQLTTAPELPAIYIGAYCYYEMFYGCRALVSVPNLPATELNDNCYYKMFTSCSSLVTAQESLPASYVYDGCYAHMFQGCSHLTTPPNIEATAIYMNGCDSMFYGCIALRTAPSIDATTVEMWGCSNMFYGCLLLTTPPALPAVEIDEDSYYRMFYNCRALKVYSTYASEHSAVWDISSSEELSDTYPQSDMFYGTVGDWSGTIDIPIRVYTQNTPV